MDISEDKSISLDYCAHDGFFENHTAWISVLHDPPMTIGSLLVVLFASEPSS